jgi:hypothetical protein
MNFPFEAVEISFSDKLPDRSKQKIGRENQVFRPTFRVFANRLILSETPFSGQRCEPIPNILWLQENFAKKVTQMIFANEINSISASLLEK